jgi:hypothetical protein
METNITAAFLNSDDLKQAEEELVRQGVIEVRTLPPLRLPRPAPVDSAKIPGAWQLEMGEETVFPLHVFVEKSRFRQAEDTIRKFGGNINIY